MDEVVRHTPTRGSRGKGLSHEAWQRRNSSRGYDSSPNPSEFSNNDELDAAKSIWKAKKGRAGEEFIPVDSSRDTSTLPSEVDRLQNPLLRVVARAAASGGTSTGEEDSLALSQDRRNLDPALPTGSVRDGEWSHIIPLESDPAPNRTMRELSGDSSPDRRVINERGVRGALARNILSKSRASPHPSNDHLESVGGSATLAEVRRKKDRGRSQPRRAVDFGSARSQEQAARW